MPSIITRVYIGVYLKVWRQPNNYSYLFIYLNLKSPIWNSVPNSVEDKKEQNEREFVPDDVGL